MQINLSEVTIKTVHKALKNEKSRLESMLRRIESGTASKEKEPEFKASLEAVKDALFIFGELAETVAEQEKV